MKKGTLIYPCKMHGVLYPAGTVVDVVDGADEYSGSGGKLNMRDVAGSNQVAIIFPGSSHPTLHASSHVSVRSNDDSLTETDKKHDQGMD